ncbi:MAG TPA: glycosyltransferase family 2 protein, partial [Chloroflexota bacterium]|nr:glycosyltransferase family 2 protein [Chloroflexota bacterium]
MRVDSPAASRIAVVIVSFNTAALLARCLDAVLAQVSPDDEVVVVDNASSDASATIVRDRYPTVRLIQNQQNRGFGAGCNTGIRATHAPLVLLLNPDCRLAPGSVGGLLRFMQSHPRAAVAGGRLRYGDGSFQHSAFRFPTLWQVLLDLFPLDWRLADSALNGRYPRGWDGRAFQIDHPLGALMCVRRSAIDTVGLFDEDFFMYAEEVDWCLRFKRAGWEIWHCPEALAVHLGGQATRQHADAMFVQLHRSRFRLFAKHYPAWFSVMARGIVRAGMLRRAAQSWLRLRGRPAAERRA